MKYVILLGVAIGYGVGCAFWPGGYDALVWYMRPWFSGTTAPAWVYALTYPLSLLGWPLCWQVLVVLTVLAVGVTAFVWDNESWWAVLFSAPLMWAVWLGQIELFPVAGLLITGLVLRGRIHPAWLGVSWLAYLTKPQVGLGLLVLQLIWFRRALFWSVVVCVAILVVTVVVWPGWILDWVLRMVRFRAEWNASIWPFGLLAWLVVIPFFRVATDREKVCLVLAATVLSSPYFLPYHCLTMLTLVGSPLVVGLSWLTVFLGDSWGWLLPAGVIVYVLTSVRKSGRMVV